MLSQTPGAFRLIFRKLSSIKKHSNFTDAVLKGHPCVHVHVHIVPTMLTELLHDSYTPLHYAAREGHTTCVEHLSTLDVNIKSCMACGQMGRQL